MSRIVTEVLARAAAGIKKLARGNSSCKGPRNARLSLEALEERDLMSASPLVWTAPAGNSKTNAIVMNVVKNIVEISDNGQLAAAKAVSSISSITLNGDLGHINDFEILGTPAGLQTTINLLKADSVIVGATIPPPPPPNPLGLQPPVVAGSVQAILGALNVVGPGASVYVTDTTDAGSHAVVLSSGGLKGLAPAPITMSGVDSLTVHGSRGLFNSYTITGSPAGHSSLYAAGAGTAVTVRSSSGSVSVFGGAGEVANLYGASSGASTLTAYPTGCTMAGTGYSSTVSGFGQVNAYGLGPGNNAFLYGASTGTNSLTATATGAVLKGPGYINETQGFQHVVAYSQSAADIAYLYGPSTGANNLVATPTDTYLVGTGYDNEASGFHSVYACSGSASDFADFHAPGGDLYATPTLVQLSGSNYFIQAAGFSSNYEYLTGTPYGLTRSGGLMQQIAGQWTQIGSGIKTVGVSGLVSSNNLWDLTSSGAHVLGPSSVATDGVVDTLNVVGQTTTIQGQIFQDLFHFQGLSYTEMLAVFGAVEKEGAVNSMTLQGLQALVTGGTTGYVQDLANDVVYGQQDNAYYLYLDSSGNERTMPLGNLQAGSSTSHLTDLVNKWFLGMNEPESAKAYSPVGGTLFGSAGPVYTDVQQRAAGDCWLMASLAEVAARQPGLINSMFIDDGVNVVNGATVHVYTVRFYDFGVPRYVTVDTELPAGGNYYDQPINHVLWVALLEKAYAQANGAGYVQTDAAQGHSNTNTYEALNGGWPSDAMPAIIDKGFWDDGLAQTDLAADFQAGQFVVLCTAGATPQSPYIVPTHCYALVNYNPSSSEPFQLYNPWGTTASGMAPCQENGHDVYGLFWTDMTFISHNFTKESHNTYGLGVDLERNVASPLLGALPASLPGAPIQQANNEHQALTQASLNQTDQCDAVFSLIQAQSETALKVWAHFFGDDGLNGPEATGDYLSSLALFSSPRSERSCDSTHG